MSDINLVQARTILVDELGYSPGDAQLFVDGLSPLREPLAGAVQTWLNDRTVADVQVGDLSIKEVMRVRNCHFLMAVRYLNRALDPGMPEERRQRMIDHLRHPVARW